MNLKILILGHPRCGSGFSAYYLNLLGLKISHEIEPINDDQGLSSWAFTIKHTNNDNIRPRYGENGAGWRKKCSFEKTIVHIRNPFDAMESIVNENKVKWSFEIRNKYIKKILNKEITGNELERAILSYLYWYEILLNKYDYYFRIEHDLDDLQKYIVQNFNIEVNNIKNTEINKKVNTKLKNKKFTKDTYSNVDPEIMKKLNDFCIKLNYPTFEKYFKV